MIGASKMLAGLPACLLLCMIGSAIHAEAKEQETEKFAYHCPDLIGDKLNTESCGECCAEVNFESGFVALREKENNGKKGCYCKLWPDDAKPSPDKIRHADPLIEYDPKITSRSYQCDDYDWKMGNMIQKYKNDQGKRAADCRFCCINGTVGLKRGGLIFNGECYCMQSWWTGEDAPVKVEV